MGAENPVDSRLPAARLAILGLQHVLVMYVGAIAVPLIVGRVLKLAPEQVSALISADLFCCGLVTILQSLGAGAFIGIRLPVMMGVTFAAVGPMVSIAANTPGVEGLLTIFGSGMVAGLFGMLIAPLVSRFIRYFPPVVTGAVICIIGISLMRVGINWIFGLPVGPTAPKLVDPAQAGWLAEVGRIIASQSADAAPLLPAVPKGLGLMPSVPNPKYAAPLSIALSALVMLVILLVARFGKGFLTNVSVLAGVVAGAFIATLTGSMSFANAANAALFSLVTPFQFGMPIFDLPAILLMCVVMVIVLVESTGMFLALGDLTGRPVGRRELTLGLRTDGLGTLLGGILNTFPHTSFSQNVGLVAVTGVKSRFVCVAGGVILIALGMIPKLGALVEAIPNFVLGGAGLVMFGMVAATGMRILGKVDFDGNRNNLLIVAISIGVGMIPLVAPDFKQWMPHALHPIVESGIVLTTVFAVALNVFFNGPQETGAARHV